MDIEEHDKALITRHNRFLKEKRAEQLVRHNEIYDEYVRLLSEPGAYDETVIPIVCEKFNCRVSTIRRIVARKAGAISPKTKAITEGLIVENLGKLYEHLCDERLECQVELENLDEREEAGEQFVTVELTEGEHSKQGTVHSEKRIPIIEARRRVYDRMNKSFMQMIEAVAKLLPRDVVNINMGNDDIRRRSIDDLDRELVRLKEMRNTMAVPVDAEISEVERG